MEACTAVEAGKFCGTVVAWGAASTLRSNESSYRSSKVWVNIFGSISAAERVEPRAICPQMYLHIYSPDEI